MAKETPPTIEEIEKKVDEVMKSADVNNDKKISLPEFISYATKNKEVLSMLNCYGCISKDDLRQDFGGNDDKDLPDCDSDLENEVNNKEYDREEGTMDRKAGLDFKVKIKNFILVRKWIMDIFKWKLLQEIALWQ